MEPGTLWFQDNNEVHYAREVTSTSNISVATNFIISHFLLYIIYILIISMYIILYTYLPKSSKSHDQLLDNARDPLSHLDC